MSAQRRKLEIVTVNPSVKHSISFGSGKHKRMQILKSGFAKSPTSFLLFLSQTNFNSEWFTPAHVFWSSFFRIDYTLFRRSVFAITLDKSVKHSGLLFLAEVIGAQNHWMIHRHAIHPFQAICTTNMTQAMISGKCCKHRQGCPATLYC